MNVGGREPLRVGHDAAAAFVLEVHHPRELLFVDAVGVVDEAARVRQRHGLGPEVDQLLHRVLGDVARAAHEAGLALERIVAGPEHLLGEVDGAVAGRLRSDQGAAGLEPLAGDRTGELVRDALVLAEQVADLASADTDVARGHVGVRPDVAMEPGHERLAEPHHFLLALALGIEVGAALARTQGQRRERVLEDLLEGEELQHAQIHGRMESKAALVRSDGARHLHPVATVHLHLAAVVDPRDAEGDHALGLHEPLQHPGVAVDGEPIDAELDRAGRLSHCLQELRFVRVPGRDIGHQTPDVLTHRFSRPHRFVRCRTDPSSCHDDGPGRNPSPHPVIAVQSITTPRTRGGAPRGTASAGSPGSVSSPRRPARPWGSSSPR